MLPLVKWATQKTSWMLLGFSALALELAALYFQYGMMLEPCIMCIYQRVAIAGIMFSGFITAIAPHLLLMRAVGFSLWGVSAIWGLLIAAEHVSIQQETDPFVFTTCAREPNFPAWLQLHEWIPALFEARGDCGDINWQFLSLSMPQWMMVLFAGYSLAFILVIAVRLFKERKL